MCCQDQNHELCTQSLWYTGAEISSGFIMITKELLKEEIDWLDETYLELLYNIISQFPHVSQEEALNQQIGAIFQDIADSGGLGIQDPLKWQQEIRKDHQRVK